MKTNIHKLLTLIGLIYYSTITQAHFGQRGPLGGSVSCGISVTTGTLNVVYLGTFDGGVFESTTTGITAWRARPVGLKSGKINTLIHTGSYLFAATDTGIYRFTGFVGSDRYWEEMNSGLTNKNVKALVAIDTITLLAGTDGSGIFKTTNKGGSWTTANSGLPVNAVVTSLAKAGSRLFAAIDGARLYASDNNGTSWFAYSGISTTDITSLSYNTANDTLMAVNSNNVIYVFDSASVSTDYSEATVTGLAGGVVIRSISNNGSDWYLATNSGIYTSDAATINWSAINTGLTSNDINVVVPVAFTSSRLIAGTTGAGIFKADYNVNPASISWAATNSNFNNLKAYAMIASGVLTGSKAFIVTATEKGVFKSIDGVAANHTRMNNGLTDSLNVNDLCYAQGCVIAATTNAGVFFTLDSGKTAWSSANTGLSNLNIKRVFCNNWVKYAICSNGNVYKSPLHSYSWTMISEGLPVGVNPTSLSFFGNTMVLTTSTHGVYKRAIDGTTWSAVNSGLTNMNVTSITVQYNRIFIGTDGSGVFKSDTGAIYWQQVTAPSIAHTTMLNLDGNKIQALRTLGTFVFASYKGGLLATSDEGDTWIAGGNQFNLPTFANVYDIEFVSTHVMVSTSNNGIYANGLSELPLVAKTFVVSKATGHDACDGSATVDATGETAPYTYAWSNGATTQTVSNLCSETYTVIVSDASTKKDTVTIAIGHIEDHETAINSNDNVGNISIYPNPNNGSFSILFSNNSSSKTIEIYNSTGVLLQRVNEEDKLVTIKTEYPSGIYFVRIENEGQAITKKIIIQ
jgi:hypothetical protein